MDYSEFSDLVEVASESVPEDLKGADEAQAAATDDLLGIPNVQGVGVGLKITDGAVTTKPSVMVLVDQKLPKEVVGSELVPGTVNKVPTDVVSVGQLFAGGALDSIEPADEGDTEVQTLRARTRPVRPGYSVGHYRITAGTIGAGAYDLSPLPGKPPRYYILSNNHVLANSNAARIGDPILQPGPVDGGRLPRDRIGSLSRFVPIRFNDGSCNTVDAAVAEVPFEWLDRDIYWNGYPRTAAATAKVGTLVKKTGRTTNFTTGRVTAINATVNVNYGSGNVAKFCRQIVTTDMSAGGDSGSLVLDWQNNPIGLLFAGSSTATILNQIALAQILLRVRIWP